jgi:hypothetical protein
MHVEDVTIDKGSMTVHGYTADGPAFVPFPANIVTDRKMENTMLALNMCTDAATALHELYARMFEGMYIIYTLAFDPIRLIFQVSTRMAWKYRSN